jgi:hypothetical protein
VLNLTMIETIFDEKRPFFVDSRRMFEGGSIDADTRYFYTRRIGAIPRQTAGDAPEGAPTMAAILGAGKLFGRTLSGLSAGALVAVSDRTEAADHTPLAPLTAFGIARAQRHLDAPTGPKPTHAASLPSGSAAAKPSRHLPGRAALSRSGSPGGMRASGIARRYARTTRQEAVVPSRFDQMGRTPCIAGTATVMKLSTRGESTWQ